MKIGIFFSLLLSLHANSEVQNKDDSYQNLENFQKVLELIQKTYVKDVSQATLIEGAIEGMMSKLDPHSFYLSESLLSDFKSDSEGQFGGFGMETTIREGQLIVVSVVDHSPAQKSGIKPGDQLIRVGQKSLKGLSMPDVIQTMKGKIGDKIQLTLYRPQTDALMSVELKRAIIKVDPIRTDLIEKNFAYARILTFQVGTAEKLKIALKKIFNKNSIKGLILDLRSNPGGLLDEAVKVSSLFQKSGIVVSIEGRDFQKKEIRPVLQGESVPEFAQVPMVALIDSGTASAAEIVAGSLQDWKRALIVGERSFGKGSVQQVHEIGKNQAVKLTIARYFTPSGRAIQEIGIEPDLPVDLLDFATLESAKVKRKNIREEELEGHLKSLSAQDEKIKNSSRIPASQEELDTRPSSKDNVAQAAVQYLKAILINQEKIQSSVQ